MQKEIVVFVAIDFDYDAANGISVTRETVLTSLTSGGNAVSDASGVMKAMDAMNNIGPSGSAFLGQTTTTTAHQSVSDQARGSSLNAGDDVIINAGNNATISGSQVNAGRNITVDAYDILITAAENRTTVNDTHEYDQVGVTLSANQSGASLTIGFAQSESRTLLEHRTGHIK